MMIVEIGKVLGKSALKKSALFCLGIFWSYLLRDNRENKKRELMPSFLKKYLRFTYKLESLMLLKSMLLEEKSLI
jgi:hypothetical protein